MKANVTKHDKSRLQETDPAAYQLNHRTAIIPHCH